MSDAPERVTHEWPECGEVEYIRADLCVLKPRENHGSHWATCYEAHGHHDCALRRIAELEASLEYEKRMRQEREAWRVEDQERIAKLEARIAERDAEIRLDNALINAAEKRVKELVARLATLEREG